MTRAGAVVQFQDGDGNTAPRVSAQQNPAKITARGSGMGPPPRAGLVLANKTLATRRP